MFGFLFSDRNSVSAVPNVVNTFNTRSGNVSLTSTDVTSALTFTPANQVDLSTTNTNLANNYYTSSASNSLFALLGSSYTKTESDGRYAPNTPVVTSLNNLTNGVTLAAGSNITITPSGNTLTIASNPPPQPYINPLRVATLQWYEANQTSINFFVGGDPDSAAFDGANIWITDQANSSVVKLRASDGANLGSFPSGGLGAYGIAFDGMNLWVGNQAGVTRLRASDGTNLGTTTLPGMGTGDGIAFDGSNIWVASSGGGPLCKIRQSDGALLGSFFYPDSPVMQRIAFDGANIWVQAVFQNKVLKIRPSDGGLIGAFSVGIAPTSLAFDGTNIWVTNLNSHSVTKLRASDGTNLGTFSVGANPSGIAFDGANIWVTNRNDNNVTKLRASDGATLGTFSVGLSPWGIVFDGANMWVVNTTNTRNGSVTKL